jgi:hypothetical protein
MKNKLCMKCAAKAHAGGDCPAARDADRGSDSRKNGKNSLHAMIMAMETEEAVAK